MRPSWGDGLQADNERPFASWRVRVAELDQTIDRPALQPVAARTFVYAGVEGRRGDRIYHSSGRAFYYSNAYQLVGKEVDARSKRGKTVEFRDLLSGKRVCSHTARSKTPY